ncbi:amine oxidase [Hysterangium stoloniferum]|nr:amine oxidase [Hysterangium stoloniferum]
MLYSKSRAITVLTLALCAALASSAFKTVAAAAETTNVVKARVAILGGGMAGIIAARTLHEQGVEDFVIVEARDELGGRMQNFALANGAKVELGPNWVQGLGEGATQNPIYTLALKDNLTSVFSNFSDLATFDNHGPVNMDKELNALDDAFSAYLAAAGERILNQQGDLTARAGLSVSGYKPRTSLDDAAEYFTFDFEFAEPPEDSSFIASAENNNFTYNGFSDENNLVVDQRGFKTIAQTEAFKFLNKTDSRLLLGHTVTNIKYTSTGVTIQTKDGPTIEADYAICTFSVGVLQNDDVTFSPPLPAWKQEAIYGMNMAVYTKIFLVFNTTFWSPTQFQLYADPSKRGYYPVWQSLDLPTFLPGSHVLFSTVTGRESIRIERQSDEDTKVEMMAVLRSMYGQNGTQIPDPVQIHFKRWHSDPLFRGTYSNWGTSYPPAVFDNLRAPLRTRLWFAGEATSFKYFGFLQGAYFEGMNAATNIVQCLRGACAATPSSASQHAVVPACGKTFLEEDGQLALGR